MTETPIAPAELQRGIVPPGTYAGGKRSPIVWVYLCAPCAGYAPMTVKDYSGALSGQCQGCGSGSRELHRFSALINSARECECHTWHERVTGDLSPSLPGFISASDLRSSLDSLITAEQDCMNGYYEHGDDQTARDHEARAEALRDVGRHLDHLEQQ